jgi:hypothetical protein
MAILIGIWALASLLVVGGGALLRRRDLPSTRHAQRTRMLDEGG